jgi:hypothetical protein
MAGGGAARGQNHSCPNAARRGFHGLNTQGRNYLVCPGIAEPYERRFDKLILRIISCQGLLRELGDDLGP